MREPIVAVTAALAARFRIEGELGAGGMATVYRATDLKHRRPVAVKVLRPELAVAIGRDRFLREIELAAGLQHPHILGLIDSGEAGGQALTAIDACPPRGTVFDEFAPAWALALRGVRPVLSERFTNAAAQGPPLMAVWVGGLFALLGAPDQALHWMRIAIERGFTNERWFTELDPFLTQYRDDPDYLALIARAKELRESISV